MSDGFFILGFFFFFFIAWIASGGPTKPISFAGPYITPITTVGTIQTGYGSTGSFGSQSIGSAQSALSNIENSLGGLNKQVQDAKLFGEASQYKDDVTISWGNSLGGSDPKQEYIALRVSDNAPPNLDITGWKLVAVSNDATVVIPRGQQIYSLTSSATQDITVQPNDVVYVNSGESPLPQSTSFRENECMGYFTQGEPFVPSLSQTCPSAQTDFNTYYQGNQYKDGQCYQVIQNTNSCQIPADNTQISSDCFTFIENYLNYPGCVANHHGDQYFSGSTWRVYLNRTAIMGHQTDTRYYGTLWRSTHDAIKLEDASGKTVDLYEY